ncbi:hypothetical protein R1flu_026295 [Riccia fluitans]|uniref:Ubiquitin-like protease family profile domain-containing protein n=1 Tax=Riccia fluitans TaxID=41844 RepID=A0ABD1XFJ3_9MARC
MWRADNVIAGVSFVRGHHTLQDEVDQTCIDVRYSFLLDGLKAAAATLPNSLVVFDYMRSIFDSYVNPSNDPNVQPLVKGLDADDFSVDKFFGLEAPTSPNDVQASPDFEEDLRTNERVRLRVEIINLQIEPQRLTRSTRICLEYEPTILLNIPLTDNPARPITLDLTMDAREDPSSWPESQIVPVPTFVDLTQYMSSPENKGSEDQGWPQFHDEDMQGNLLAWIFVPIHGKNHWSLAIIRLHNDIATLAHLDSFRGTHDPKAIFHVFKTVLCLIVSIDPALIMTAIINVEQQQDGHSCGKHVLQMLIGAAVKESDGLDRCFRRRGLDI